MLNKRYLVLLTLLSAVCFRSIAQNFNVYLGASLQSQSIHHHTTEATYTSVLPINDSLAIRRTIHEKSEKNTSYETSPGFSAGINYRQKIGNRWTVVSGLGIVTGKMKIVTDNSIGSFTILKSDTIPYLAPTILQSCDTTIFTGDFDARDPFYNWVQLEIPLLIRYDIMPGQWSIGIGAKLSTPLYTVRNYFSSTFSTSINEQNQSVCTINYKYGKDKSGNGFRDLNLGLAADMEYWFKKWGVSIGVEQRLTNIFSPVDHQQLFEDVNYAKPIYTYIRLLYKL